jgi:hypothetical protein
MDGGTVDRQGAAVEMDFRTAEFYHRTGHMRAASYYYAKVARSGDPTFAPKARELLADLKERYGSPVEPSKTIDQKATEPDEEKLDGEWMGRVDGVAITLVFGPKDSVLLITGDGSWARGSYSVDFKKQPHLLSLHWKQPVGKLKTERVQTILQLEEDGRLRIEAPSQDEPRPGKLTAKAVVLVKDYRLPSGEKGHPPAETANTPPQPPPQIIDQTPPQIRTPDSAEKKADRVGEIIIVGNTKTATSVILKKILLCPGQILDYQVLRTAEKNLAELNATITVIENRDRTIFKDILVRVKEK